MWFEIPEELPDWTPALRHLSKVDPVMKAVVKRVGKVAVLVGVCNGFVGNRMLFQRRLEADQLVLEGATPAQVDRVLCDFGFPMGPFAMSDLAGLDIGWKAETSTGSRSW